MKLTFHPFDLELKHTFTISRESHDIQKTLIVELTDGVQSGFGEATANPYYGVTVEKMMNDLAAIRPLIEESKDLLPEELWAKAQPQLRNNHFALCALDIAMNDLWGRKKQAPLYKLWGLSTENLPLTNYTIGIDSVEKMVQKMQEFPWPLYKIKLGTKEDVKIIRELRTHTDALFRVDANCAWSVEETIANSRAFRELQVEFIEQPLRADDFDGMKRVYEQSALPLVADESCMVENDVKKCYKHFHGINIKLTKCGGLTPARRMIREGKSLGMKIMVGCMTESTVGISAIAHLLPLLDYVDMDGAMLLKKDVADGVKIVDQKVIFPERNGIGSTLLKQE